MAHRHEVPIMAIPAKPLQHRRQRDGVVGQDDPLPTGGLPANAGEAESSAWGTDTIGHRRQLRHLRLARNAI